VDQDDTAAVLAGKLAGWYSWLRTSGKRVIAALKSQSLVERSGQPSSAPLRLGRFR
jgi:hypothetical protein